MKTAAPRLRVEIAAGLVGWIAVAASWLRPHLLANEMVYLLTPLRFREPELLAADWSWGGDPWVSTSALFGLVVSPLWALTDRPEVLALVGRGAGWALMVGALMRLGRSFKLSPWWVALALAAFVGTGQGPAAGEGMGLGGARKNFAHAAVLLALANLVDGRPGRAGVYSGVGVAMHALVGGWFGIAAGAAGLVSWSRFGWRGAAKFAVGALVIGLPFLGLAAADTFAAEPGVVADPARQRWLLTTFRNPHHTWPAYFLGAGKLLSFAGLAVAATVAAGKRLGDPQARAPTAVLAVCVALYAAGWLAGKLQAPTLLVYYPFRLGDVLVPLLFWMLVPATAAAVLAEARGQWHRDRVVVALASVGLAMAVGMLASRGPAGLRRVKATADAWPMRTHPLDEAAAWIRAHTGPDETFVAPPCEFDFWVRARRPVVVNYKAVPHGPRALQWYERLRAVGGGEEIEATGFAVCKPVDRGAGNLDRAALAALSERYAARWYLVRGSRPDLADLERFRGGRHAVYDIGRL